MPCRKDKPALLDAAHAGCRPAVAVAAPCPHLHKDQGSVGLPQNQVDFSSATPGCPIMPLNQTQACLLQVAQGGLFRPVSLLAGAAVSPEPGHGRLSLMAVVQLSPPSSVPSALTALIQSMGMDRQSHPAGCLYVVATPIGNLGDISVRALHVLQLADAIACEDTRHTQAMLGHYGLTKPLLPVHEHNETEMATQVVTRLQAGERIAYVSDAGTPAVSDPGARLVAACQAAGLRCVPLPGASSVTSALSVSGAIANGTGTGGFVFWGFLDSRAQAREQQVQAIAGESRTVLLLEAPHRIEACLQALSGLGGREVTVAREISKQFEQIVRLHASHGPEWLRQSEHHGRGEFVLVVHPVNQRQQDSGVPPRSLHVLQLLMQELPLKSAVKLAADITGTARNSLYEQALLVKAADKGRGAA